MDHSSIVLGKSNIMYRVSTQYNKDHNDPNNASRYTPTSVMSPPLLGPVHMGPQAINSKSLEVNLCNLSHWEHQSWDLSLHMGSHVLSPKYDMDVYMATFLGGEAQDLCWELG